MPDHGIHALRIGGNPGHALETFVPLPGIRPRLSGRQCLQWAPSFVQVSRESGGWGTNGGHHPAGDAGLGTRMRWSWTMRLRGAMRVLSPVVRAIGPRWEHRNWAGLKQLMESGQVHLIACGRRVMGS